VALTLSETATQPVKPSGRTGGLGRQRSRRMWLLLLPSVIPVVIFSVYPLLNVPWAMPSVMVAILGNLIYQPDASLLNDAADEAAFGRRRTALGDLQSAPRTPLEVG
jgi:ABC-type sugar transport system permease subunit